MWRVPDFFGPWPPAAAVAGVAPTPATDNPADTAIIKAVTLALAQSDPQRIATAMSKHQSKASAHVKSEARRAREAIKKGAHEGFVWSPEPTAGKAEAGKAEAGKAEPAGSAPPTPARKEASGKPPAQPMPPATPEPAPPPRSHAAKASPQPTWRRWAS